MNRDYCVRMKDREIRQIFRSWDAMQNKKGGRKKMFSLFQCSREERFFREKKKKKKRKEKSYSRISFLEWTARNSHFPREFRPTVFWDPWSRLYHLCNPLTTSNVVFRSTVTRRRNVFINPRIEIVATSNTNDIFFLLRLEDSKIRLYFIFFFS